jgi:hypothetical protein
MPPATGDAGVRKGGRQGARDEPFTLLHQDTTFQGYNKNPAHCKVSVYIRAGSWKSGTQIASVHIGSFHTRERKEKYGIGCTEACSGVLNLIYKSFHLLLGLLMFLFPFDNTCHVKATQSPIYVTHYIRSSVKWMRHVANMEEMRNIQKFLVVKLQGVIIPKILQLYVVEELR